MQPEGQFEGVLPDVEQASFALKRGSHLQKKIRRHTTPAQRTRSCSSIGAFCLALTIANYTARVCDATHFIGMLGIEDCRYQKE